MKKTVLSIAILTGLTLSANAQFNLKKLEDEIKTDVAIPSKDQIKNAIPVSAAPAASSLSNSDIISGLKEALTVGTNNSTSLASKLDGFYQNANIKIPFPPETQNMESVLRNMGMGAQVDKVVLTMNRAAETASKEAAPVFVNAIKGMNVTDGMAILNGGDDAATNYLKTSTSTELLTKFKPIIQQALQQVQLTKYWSPLMTTYNKVPLVTKMNPDLDSYVTDKALNGLFFLVAAEEAKIRKDPKAQVSDILKKVFGK